MIRRRKSCRKCVTDIPHPFAHWHAWCALGRHIRIYRGPCCGKCLTKARTLAAPIIKDFLRGNS